MLRILVQNEMFTFDFDSENAILNCTLDTEGWTLQCSNLVQQKGLVGGLVRPS